MDDLFVGRPEDLVGFGNENGIYLESIQIQNWGPFNGGWKAPLMCLPALFIGENGTGKSSLMDGVLTLLVSKGLKYNNASDTKGKRGKSERKLVEYVRGFKESSRDEDLYKKVLYQREIGEISVILLQFHCEDKVYTIANVFMAKESDEVSTLYLWKEGYFSLEDLPKKAGTFEEYRSAVRKMQGIQTGDRPKYFAFIQDKLVLDLNGQALLASLSSKKDLAAADAMIREYMYLERGDFRKNYEDAKGALENVRAVMKTLRDVRERNDILGPLKGYIEECRMSQKDLALWTACREKDKAFVFGKARAIAEKELASLEGKVQDAEEKVHKIQDKIERAVQDKAALEARRDNEGGGKLARAEMELQYLQDQLDVVKQKRAEYCEILQAVGLKKEPTDDASFRDSKVFISNKMNELEKAKTKAEGDYRLAQNANDKAGATLRVKQRLKESLETNRIAIDPLLVTVRNELCQYLGVSTNTMPFLGEYLSVDDKEWLPAIEYVMRRDSVAFLVPIEYQKDTAKFMKSHKKSGRRIRYIVMHPFHGKVEDGAWQKITVRSGMLYEEWVRSYLKYTVRYKCCENEEEFVKAKPPSMMKNGLIRTNDHRHDIDERPGALDASNFVMSGSYETRRLALEKELKEAEKEKRDAEKQLVATNKAVKQIENELNCLARIDVASYKDINVGQLETDIVERQQVLSELKSSKNLVKLDESIERIQIRISDLKEDQKKGQDEVKSAVEALSAMRVRISDYYTQFDAITFTDDETKLLEEIFEKRKPASENPAFNTVMGVAREITKACNRIIEGLEDEVKESAPRARSLMRQYLDKNPARKNDLVASMEYGDGEAEKFIDEYNRVHDEFLPEAEAKMKDIEILGKRSALTDFIIGLTHDVDDSVKAVIEKLNQVLHNVVYTHDVDSTFLNVGFRVTRDQRITMLRDRLEAVARLMGDTEAQEEMLERFEDLMQYIEQQVGQDKKIKGNILDVRNWFEYPITECRWDDETKKSFHTVKELDEVAKQSGGEGVKLTYFIMAGCFSMWMHLLDEEYDRHTFRFLMIDEADTKISPSNLEDVICLFHDLGIQLVSLLPISDKVSQYEGFVGNVVTTGFLRKPKSYLETITYTEYVKRNQELLAKMIAKSKEIYHGKNSVSE